MGGEKKNPTLITEEGGKENLFPFCYCNNHLFFFLIRRSINTGSLEEDGFNTHQRLSAWRKPNELQPERTSHLDADVGAGAQPRAAAASQLVNTFTVVNWMA